VGDSSSTHGFLRSQTFYQEDIMSENFYDKVAKKFGAPGPQVKHSSEYPAGNPEQIFEQKVLELGSKDKVALDAGCGSGGFTLRIAPHFGRIVGIDSSAERLKQARAEQQAQGISNAQFELREAQQSSFAPDTFDVVYSRRGPTPYSEYYRILKTGGHFLHIGIGEKDAWELKRTFGRGQGFWEWKISALEQAVERLQQAGFDIVYGQEFLYDEYYASYHDLDHFLQGVPIFENFDSEQDRARLEAYVASFQNNRGIHLPRHRFVVVARKP
jgi:SAM-dependent methyltransferase